MRAMSLQSVAVFPKRDIGFPKNPPATMYGNKRKQIGWIKYGTRQRRSLKFKRDTGPKKVPLIQETGMIFDKPIALRVCQEGRISD